ncbi:hypothetical protein AGOR_G00212750 [Albula goreensis]|uniref:C2H2-type domain-containing protein n=1 Tax=Albula goreensis TaxID=1534307 RepID=A0A8T3CRF8_9TELE|nr:hypothetical protein AGOR_G00212750 [Albula goreensis]
MEVTIKTESGKPEERRGAEVKEEEHQESKVNGTTDTSPVSVLQCRQCGVGFCDGRARRRHLRLSHPEEYQERVLTRARLRCHLCGLPCLSSRQLIEHQRSQHPLGHSFQCPVCGDSFIQSHALLNHQRRHIRQSRYTCRDCPHTSRSLAQHLAHRHAHAPVGHLPATPPQAASSEEEPQPSCGPSLQCPECFITFRDLQTSQQHLRLQHPTLYERQLLRGRTVFACRNCDLTFPSSRLLSAHQRTHRHRRGEGEEPGEGEERSDAHLGHILFSLFYLFLASPLAPEAPPLPVQHMCPHCNFLFRDVKTKMRHMNVKHPPGRPLPPPLLLSAEGEVEEEEEEVEEKKKKEEEEEEVVVAVQIKEEDQEEVKQEEGEVSCVAPRSRGDPTPGSANEERVEPDPVKLDNEEKGKGKEEGACDCPLCGKGFEQLLAVARRRRRGRRRDHPSPPGLRGHACGHCGQLCHSQGALQQHQRLHTLERPYCCQHCGNTFKKASGLQRHKSVHSRDPANSNLLLSTHSSTRSTSPQHQTACRPTDAL